MGQINHIIITPVRNERQFLPAIIDSVISQNIKPSRWVIVDDNSTDGTSEILREVEERIPWIEIVRVDNDLPRERGGKIAKLVVNGLSTSNSGWDYFSKIDADMVLPETYFEDIFTEFENDHKLGIASGNCLVLKGGKWRLEKVAPEHTRGGIKTYRAKCFNEIGGIEKVDGWDGIDNIKAQMAGWKTLNFPNILVRHMRRTGFARGAIRGRFESGRICHFMGYHPIFMTIKSAVEVLFYPQIIGGIAMFAGYLVGIFTRRPIFQDSEVVSFIRKKQLARIGLGRLNPIDKTKDMERDH